jgi:hypothetical protein
VRLDILVPVSQFGYVGRAACGVKNLLEKNEKKEKWRKGLAFFPALCKEAVLLQRDWLTWSVIHRPHPEDCLCRANTDACSVRDASLWIKHECLTSLPAFNWLYSQHIRTKSSANLYAECTADAVLFANIRKYCDWHLIHLTKRSMLKLFKPYGNFITPI